MIPVISPFYNKMKYLNQNPITMIHLMLNDLCRPSGEVFRSCLHIQGLILYLDGLISLTLTGDAEKRQTAFLGVVRAVLLDDLGIEHHRIGMSSSALVAAKLLFVI